MLIADLYYHLAHDAYEGTPRMNRSTTSLGLSAALLAELVVAQKIRIDDSGLLEVCDSTPSRDPLSHLVLDTIGKEEPRPLRDWLHYWSHTAAEEVGKRLMRDNRVVRRDIRHRLRRHTVYMPVTPTDFESVVVKLVTLVSNSRIQERSYGWATVLADTTGLLAALMPDPSPATKFYIQWCGKQLGADGIELMNITAAAIGSAAFTGR